MNTKNMKTIFTLLFSLIVSLSFSQVFMVQYDTVTHYTCKKNMTIENMVKTKDFEIVEMYSDPGVIYINLESMMFYSRNGEFVISKVLDKEKSIDIMFGDEIRLTIRKSFDLTYVMVIQEVKTKKDKKHIYSFSNVKFVK
jgi:hypothetical protein